MSNISAWSVSDASNSALPPDGWPEGMNPSAVNDAGRAMMGAIRRWYVNAEWIDHGYNWVRQTNNSFLVSQTATDVFVAARRLRMIDGGVTIDGEVLASSMSGANTLVTVSSSALSASLSSGSVGILARSAPAPIGNLVFPATQNPSADANTLDDYEEGTWTPAIGGTATYTTQTGTYTKIGRMVYVNCALVINVIGTGSTNVISGLPFAASSSGAGALAVSSFTGAVSSFVWLGAAITASASTISIRSLTAAATSVGSVAVFTSGSSIVIAGCYFV